MNPYPDDLRHYRKIVSTLREIKNIMEDIKVIIQKANTEEIFAKVKEVIVDKLGIEANSIISSANFINIEIPDDVATQFKSAKLALLNCGW